MVLKCVKMPRNGKSISVGMGDFELLTPDSEHRVQIWYRGEPPHGDSFHEIAIDDGPSLPGNAWGCNFACTEDGRYLSLSWMAQRFERKTAGIDMAKREYLVLPTYIYDFTFCWPRLEGIGRQSAGLSFEFVGREHWIPF